MTREKIEHELERVQRDGIVEPTQFSDWAAPVVSVIKVNGSLRLCANYKLIITKAAILDSCLPLSEEYKPYATINTHKGLFQYNRLPFSVHSAPAIFQRNMESLLSDVQSTVVYLNENLISGKDEAEHLCNVDTVLERLQTEDLTLKKMKCHFMLEKIKYLGHTISAEGLKQYKSDLGGTSSTECISTPIFPGDD